MTIQEIRKRLFEMQDVEYKAFHSKLMPTVEQDAIIGVRTPKLRQFAKDLQKTEDVTEFLQSLPHEYYEENNLHGFLIEQIKDYDGCMKAVDRFLPYVDNWATCDMMAPKIFKKHLPELEWQIRDWLVSGEVYTVRFAVNMLMKYYLDEAFEPKYLEWVAQIKSQEHYVRMVVAWYFATALAKQYEAAIPYIEEQKLEQWTHNKTIQKAVESYRVSAEKKAYLKTWKRR